MPKVSVIVPNYNYECYLPSRLGSIFNQTFQDFEVIILDDKSTDNSKNIIENFRNHPKVSHVIYNKINSGSPFAQWNKGISFAKGEWIWIAEADDFADVKFLETLIENATQDKQVVISYCQSYKMNSTGEITGNWSDWTNDLDIIFFNSNFILDGKLYIKKFLHRKNTIPNASGLIFRKDAFLKAGTADEDIKYCADWLLWLKLLTIGNIAYCAEKLNYFRYHQKSVIATAINNDSNIFIHKYDIYLRKKFIKFLKINRFVKQNRIDSKKLIEIFKSSLSSECESEARFLKNHEKKRDSIKYMIVALKYSNNKRGVFYRLISKYLLPQYMHKGIRNFLLKFK